MKMQEPLSLREALEETADSKELFQTKGHGEKIAHLLRFFSGQGMALSVAADKSHLGRSEATLKKYCREHEIAFPDYVPMYMRQKKSEASA